MNTPVAIWALRVSGIFAANARTNLVLLTSGFKLWAIVGVVVHDCCIYGVCGMLPNADSNSDNNLSWLFIGPITTMLNLDANDSISIRILL